MPAAVRCSSTASVLSPLARIRVPSRLKATYRPAYFASSSGGKFRRFSSSEPRSGGSGLFPFGVMASSGSGVSRLYLPGGGGGTVDDAHGPRRATGQDVGRH